MSKQAAITREATINSMIFNPWVCQGREVYADHVAVM